MFLEVDFTKMTTSWTKYDIVQALDVVYSVETIQKYKNKEAKINEAILRSFLGIKSLEDPIPGYWIEIQKYPNEKKIFALLALIFTHGGVVNDFATKYSTGNMKGIFKVNEPSKQLTNIRSALVVSEASDPIYRRKEEVPYDFSVVFYNPNVGKLFKKVLEERISRLVTTSFSDEDFYNVCYNNKFDKALSLTHEQFKSWLEGDSFEASYIKSLKLNNFFSIKEPIVLDFEDSKEVYFLGENGDGKTLLLMALYLAFNGNFIKGKTTKEKTGRAIDILEGNRDLEGIDESDMIHTLQNAIYLNNLYAYGTHRGRYSSDTSDKFEEYGFMSLFDNNQTMKDPIQWLKDLKLNEENNITTIATTTLKEIFFDLLEKNVEIVIEGSNVYFIEKGYKLNLDELSEGYRSIIIFVCDLLYRLTDNNKDEGENILDIKGVLLIDEIDLHLHPKWQKVIVTRLRHIFPNIQFFFTTHSPTIIQGASEDAIIYKVYREGGITKVSAPYYRKDLDHLMMNTLVTSSLFGLDNSRMDSENDLSTTDDSYLLYRINLKLESEILKQKEAGKNFISDLEIDNLIENILKEELDNDKDQ